MLKRHNAFNGNLTIFFPNATKTQIVSKVEFLYLKKFHIWHRHLPTQVKRSCNTLPSLCVVFY